MKPFNESIEEVDSHTLKIRIAKLREQLRYNLEAAEAGEPEAIRRHSILNQKIEVTKNRLKSGYRSTYMPHSIPLRYRLNIG